MKNPLLSLDELIWKQCEKVNRIAYDQWGWNKYDLAYHCDTLTNISLLGYGVYLNIYGIYHEGFQELGTLCCFAAGTVSSMNGAIRQVHSKEKFFQKEDAELRVLAVSGAVRKPEFTSFRPFCLLQSFVLAATGGYIMNDGISNLSKPVTIALGLTEITAAASVFFAMGVHYFSDQQMHPPATKKSAWNLAFQKISYLLKPTSKKLSEETKTVIISSLPS